jgi:hypothetical protein
MGCERGKTREMCYLRDGVWLWSRFWRGAVAVCVVFAAAGNSSRSSHDGVDDEIGFAKRATAELAISDEQRGRIYDSVMRISDAPIAGEPAPEVADSLPEAVPMQDLPAGVTRDVPLVQGHKFVKFADRILLVSSSNRLVVAMIPRYRLLP